MKEIDQLNDVCLYFGQFVRDRAFKWYQDNLATQVNDVDAYYGLFITAFLREEPDFSKMCKLRERKYKVDDTPQTYADDILTLCQKLNLNEAAQIQYLIGGLPDQMQSFISALNPLTFSAAFNALCSMGKNLVENVNSGSTQPTSDSKLALLATQIDVLTSELQQMKLRDQTLNATYTPQHDPGRSTLLCQFCGMKNHTALTCRKITQSMQRPTYGNQAPQHQNYVSVTCNFCGRRGHMAFECRTKQRQMGNAGRQQDQSNRQYQNRSSQGQYRSNNFNYRQ